ncbi:H-NS family nucleoid-associated regulatory protein [Paraburkholderia sp. RL17-380-BIE-A]|uniref:H-NS family nucleoid-associated regulatory protein n=1 Tax=Paraburkholderia sp. RL17-380-BIE-A TaxID=3031630 RepID=UPI0038BD3A90
MATTLEAITARMKKLQAQADALATKETAKVLKTIHELMAKHGLTAADIDAHAGGKQRAKHAAAKTAAKPATSVAKYRDPKSGAAWSGHGRAPGWIASAKNRDKFLVSLSTPAAAKPAPIGQAKAAGNYIRGPQPALYRDPKSGATWSGRGRAPAWIVDAKNRIKFLIAGGAKATVATTADVLSKTKTAVKKASKAVGATSTKGQPKGPQPAKYRDPKSGATWSGRGPAPAWLAGAKDRAKFLIVGASAAADAKPAVTKAVAKKAPTAKKTAAKKAVSAKVPAKKAPAKKAPRKSVAEPTPLATVEYGAELTS